MRSRFAWLLAEPRSRPLSSSAFCGARRRRPLHRSETDPRADELRRRIAEAKDVVDEREVFEEAETPVDQADPDLRRQEVHLRGRAALERMRGEPEG